MVIYKKRITPGEQILLNDIKALQYGEIYDVEIEDEERTTAADLTRQQKELIDLIRTGVQHFKTIKIHQAEPAYAEVLQLTRSGKHRCKRLYKFS